MPARRVASPCEENLVCQIDQTILFIVLIHDDRHRPFTIPCLYILISLNVISRSTGAFAGELIMTALEMIVDLIDPPTIGRSALERQNSAN